MTNLTPLSVTRLLTLISMSLLMMTCSKDKLPEPSQNGRGTFGCKIGGKNWIPDGGTGFMPLKAINGGFLAVPARGYEIVIDIYAVSKDGQRIYLYIDEVKPGVHELNKNTQTAPASLSPKSYGLYRAGGIDYVTSSENTGRVTITRADTLRGIISGTFYFKAGDDYGNTVNITEGRFDYTVR